MNFYPAPRMCERREGFQSAGLQVQERRAVKPKGRKNRERAEQEPNRSVCSSRGCQQPNEIKSAFHCARARSHVHTFKVPVRACFVSTVCMFCLDCVQSCQENPSPGRRLAPRTRAAARCAFQDVSCRGDHLANMTNTHKGSELARPPARPPARPSFRRRVEPREPSSSGPLQELITADQSEAISSVILSGILQGTLERSCHTATWACSSRLTRATAGGR